MQLYCKKKSHATTLNVSVDYLNYTDVCLTFNTVRHSAPVVCNIGWFETCFPHYECWICRNQLNNEQYPQSHSEFQALHLERISWWKLHHVQFFELFFFCHSLASRVNISFLISASGEPHVKPQILPVRREERWKARRNVRFDVSGTSEPSRDGMSSHYQG